MFFATRLVVVMLLLLMASGRRSFSQDWQAASQELRTLCDRGDYLQALPIARQTLQRIEATPGASPLTVSTFAEIMGGIYLALGDHARAHFQFERVRHLRSSASAPLDLATAQSNLAQTYLARHESMSAKAWFDSALRIREQVHGRRHPAVASSLADLASVSEAEDRDDQAERLYREALEIVQATGSSQQPEATRAHLALGRLLARRGRIGEAEKLLEYVVSSRRTALGEKQPAYAEALAARAAVFRLAGDWERSARLLDEATRIYLAKFGPAHPSTLDGAWNLIFIAIAQERWRDALNVASAGFAYHVREQVENFGRPRYGDPGLQGWITIFDLIASRAESTPDVVAAARTLMLEAALRGKSQEQEALAGLTRDCGDPGGRACAVLQTLRQTWTQLSDLKSRIVLNTQLDAWIAHEDLLLEQLAGASPSIAAARARLGQLSPRSVVAKLGQDEVLVEIVRYEDWAPQPMNDRRRRPSRYGGLIARPAANASVEWVDLGSAIEVDEAVAIYRASMAATDNSETSDSNRETLRKRIWSPLSARLGGTHARWLISPDGALTLWPWNVFLDFERQAPELVIVPSVDALLYARETPPSHGPDLVRGASTFGAVPPPIKISLGQNATTEDKPMFSFSALRHVADEVRGVRAALGLASGTGHEPLSRRWLLDEVVNPRVLHLATHGFHLPGTGDAVLVYSGIALENANSGAAGRLSAKEAAGLRLRGTQLVTLSACESAAGDPTFADGLLGLQRSLSIAGARSQLLALWRVSDGHTRLLMEKLYARLARGERKTVALRAVQIEMAKEHPPSVWAAFVLFGDPAPLQPSVQGPRVAEDRERGPVRGSASRSDELTLTGDDGFGFRPAGGQVSIEAHHEVVRRAIVDVPERQQLRARARERE